MGMAPFMGSMAGVIWAMGATLCVIRPADHPATVTSLACREAGVECYSAERRPEHWASPCSPERIFVSS